MMDTSGFATTHVVVPGHCDEKFCFENILYFRCKLNENILYFRCKLTSKSSTARVHDYTRYFPANGYTNPDGF